MFSLIKMIVAMDMNNGIGNGNKLLCHLPNDLKYFKEVTSGQIVVMGRNTYDSLPKNSKPLKNRINIVLTNDEDFKRKNKYDGDGSTQLIFCNNVEEVLAFSKHLEYNNCVDTFIIGGDSVYKQFIEHAEMLHVTHICGIFEADTYFPIITKNEWELETHTKGVNTSESEPRFSHVTYVRKKI